MFSNIYQELRTASSTRLVQIPPSKQVSVLSLKLNEVNLDDKPIYDAISYTWGDEQDTASVSVNEVPITIRQNLLNFLIHLHNQNYSGQLWVDALSIRQGDPIEKGQQVGMIGRIFRGAKKVLVWVGEHANDSEALFKSGCIRHPVLESLRDQEHWLRAWISFLQRPYWSRLWIVQELLLAQEITIQCGDSSLPCQALMRYLGWRGYSRSSRTVVWDGLSLDLSPDAECAAFTHLTSELIDFMRMRKIRREKPLYRFYRAKFDHVLPDYGNDIQEIGRLSDIFRDRECSDPRNHVYALLSLEKSRELRDFRPDYTIGEADLFVRLCMTRLLFWPHSWMEFITGSRSPRSWTEIIRGDDVSRQASFVWRLSGVLLYEKEIYDQAVRILIQMCDDKSSTQHQLEILTLIAGGLKPGPWSSDKSPNHVLNEIYRIRITREP